MKKKKLIFITTIIICIMLCLIFSNKASKYEKDMDYFIDAINENYPYTDKIHNNLDKNKLLKNARKCETNEDFLNLLNKTLRPFNGLGHLYVLNAEEYYSHLAIYEVAKTRNENLFDHPNLMLLQNNKVRDEYDKLSIISGITYQMVKDSFKENQSSTVSENLSFQTYGNSLVIKIDSFDLSFVDMDIVRIENELKLFNGDTIVFDIRENGGGADMYWTKLVQMTSFLDYHVKKKVYGNGSLSYEYVKNELGKKAVKKHDSKFVGTYNIDIKSKKMYDFENIFILTSEKNYSSSDSFVKFSNETGYATTVGQETKGSGGGTLNPMLIELPQTHILFRMDAARVNETGTKPWIETKEENINLLLNIAIRH